MFTIQIDDEIELRLPDFGQEEELFQLIDKNREFIGRYMDWVEHTQSVEDSRKRLPVVQKEFASGYAASGKIYYHGKMVGNVAVHVINEAPRIAEVGYWLDEAHTGKGIATRAARTMVSYGFAVLGMHKIIIRAISTNEASLKVAQRLGFRHQGLDIHGKLHYGEYYDYDVYYMLEDDWEQEATFNGFTAQLDSQLDMRILEPRHAEALFQLVDANRDHLRKWMPWVDATTSPADTLDFIQGSLEQYGKQAGMNLGIWYQDELCGTIGYVYLDFANKCTEIGYWLSKAHTGKGIITRCTQALVDYAFQTLGMHRIQISCGVENERSCAVAQRLGFQHEGVIRHGEWLYDHYHDLNVYALLADDEGA